MDLTTALTDLGTEIDLVLGALSTGKELAAQQDTLITTLKEELAKAYLAPPATPEEIKALQEKLDAETAVATELQAKLDAEAPALQVIIDKIKANLGDVPAPTPIVDPAPAVAPVADSTAATPVAESDSVAPEAPAV